MGLKEQTQTAFTALGFSDIPSEWVNSLWDKNFCNETVTLPYSAVEEGVLLNVDGWENLVDTCRHWSSARNADENDRVGFWTTLMEVDVSHKCVMALLHCFMERMKQRPVDRICAVYASQLYLILLQLPSSGGFKLFHPMIFQKALDVFHLFPENSNGYKSSVPAPVIPPRGQGGRGRRSKRKRRQVVEEEEEEEGREESMECDSTITEKGGEDTVCTLLKQLIRDLYAYLLLKSLASFEVSRYQLIQVLLRMIRVELDKNSPLVLGSSTPTGQSCPVGQGAPMFVPAWACLDVLCRTLHGSIEKITSEVFRQLLPALLMLSESGEITTTVPLPTSLVTCSRHALKFVQHVTQSFNEQTHVSLKKLIQHVCTKIPERAEYRNKMATVVSQLLSLLPDGLYSEMLDWLYKFSRNIKVGFRVFALDVFNELLSAPLRPLPVGTGTMTVEAMFRLTYKFLIRSILSRCSDKSLSVRARALTCLAGAAASKSSDLEAAVRSIVFPQPPPPSRDDQGRSLIVEMIYRRTTDEKVAVRKAGLQALEAIVQMDATSIRTSDIAALHKRCLDPSLSVRKQAITSLTTLLVERKRNSKLQRYWLDAVLPMVIDKEKGGEEKSLQLLQDVLLDNLVPLQQSTGEQHELAWQLLSLISEDDRVDLQRYLRRAMERWSHAKKLSPSLVKAVCSHTELREHSKAAWMVLAEMSHFIKSIETKFLFDNWNKHSRSVSRETGSPLVQILVVIGNLASNISKVAIQDIEDDIIQLLQGFQLGPAVIQAAINTLCLISSSLNSKQNYQSSVDKWCVPLLRACEDYISSLIKERREGVGLGSNDMEVEMITYLFTLGEVAQLSPSHTSHHLCRMVQSILLASSETPNPTSSQPGESFDSLPGSQGSLPSSQGSLPSSQSQTSRSFLSGLSGLTLSPTLRAHAYITLGKLCLQNEDLTKKSVVQMVRELHTSKDPPIRNNIVVILCDLAIRYSMRVDPYIHTISACLKDESLLIRKQTLTLLARLLQEDYIKWKGALFFHFVSCLVDKELSRFAEFCLSHLLQVKNPGMFYLHFVECVFFFNSYEKHKVYNRFKQTQREKELFSLKGKKNAEKRMSIYTFLLSHMTDEQRFQLTAKLCQEVIGGLVDGAIPLDDDSKGVIEDTLAILACKEIKLTSLRRNVGEDLADEGDQMGAAVAKAQTKIISQLVKRNVMENVVPIVIAAKHLFEKEHDPLLKNLLLYLKELMQDYRNEVSEILAGDPQLVQEIQFDLKRFDEEQRKVVNTPTDITPHAMMVSPLLSPGVLGPVATATMMATPPKLRTPVGTRHKVTPPTVKTPFRLPLGVSPLVVVQKLPSGTLQGTRPSVNQTPLTSKPKHLAKKPPAGDVDDPNAENRDTTNQNPTGNEDVASPEAARDRSFAITLSYNDIKTPATIRTTARKKPSIPLQRALLLSTVRKASMHRGQNMPALPTDETILDGRLASTPAPEGFADAISFSVSSCLPPSPIIQSTLLHKDPPGHHQLTGKGGGEVKGDGGKKRSKRLKVSTGDLMGRSRADIVMTSPDAISKEPTKWKVRMK